MGKHRLLLVDDNKDLLLGLKGNLTACGYEVICAEDSISAIDVAANTNPDLILLDLSMPIWGGFKVVEWLKKNPAFAKIPFIVVTGRDGIGPEAVALAAGAAAFLRKPVNSDELLATIASVLKVSATARLLNSGT